MTAGDEGPAAREAAFTAALSLRRLRMLALLAELGSVSDVARAMHVSQPAVSKQIAQIESALGADIVQRRGNQLAFTSLGRRLVDHAREITRQVERARFDVDALRQGLGGRITVGVVSSLAPSLLPEALRLFSGNAPDAEVSLVEGHLAQMLPMLERGALDMVVSRVWQPVAAAGIEQVALMREPLLLVCGPSHPLAGRDAVDWPELTEWPWICPLPGSHARSALEAFLAARGLRLPAGKVESTSTALSLSLVAVSPHIAMMPASLARPHAMRGDISILPIQVDDLLSEARCFWRSEDPTLGLFRACLQRSAGQPRFGAAPKS